MFLKKRRIDRRRNLSNPGDRGHNQSAKDDQDCKRQLRRHGEDAVGLPGLIEESFLEKT